MLGRKLIEFGEWDQTVIRALQRRLAGAADHAVFAKNSQCPKGPHENNISSIGEAMTKAKESKSETAETQASEIESLLTSAEVRSLLDDLERERMLRMRALADFDNYRKRVERERALAAMSGKRNLILSLLEVMDDFDRALKHSSRASDAVAAGLRVIHKRIADVIKAQGVTPIETVGREFDPTLHEAVGVIEAGDGKPGMVIDQVSPGYFWNGEVLRPARVHVAK